MYVRRLNYYSNIGKTGRRIMLGTQPLTITLFIIWALFFSSLTANPANAQETKGRGIGLLEAVSVTLTSQPNILIKEKEVEIKKAVIQSARGQFDTTLGISTEYSHEESSLSRYETELLNRSEIEEDITSFEVKLTKPFRTGITLSSGLKTIRSDNTSYKFDPTKKSFDPTNKGTIDFLVEVPLLRGRGRQATMADEMAAEKGHQISLFELRHAVSENVLETVGAYWNYLAAKKNLDQLTESEARAETLVKEVTIFIDTGVLPAADLEQLVANLADKTVARIANEQRLFDARQNLGLNMGLSFEKTRYLPLPRDAFPEIEDQKIEKIYAAIEKLINESLLRRADYLASKKQQDYSSILIADAKNQMLPELNLNSRLGYSGLDEGSEYSRLGTSLGENIPGLNASLSLSYQWPLANNDARGLWRQRKSVYDQAIISTSDLCRRIRTGVLISLSGLRNSALEVKKAGEAVSSYRKAVDNEKKKFLLWTSGGISTLLDIITMENRLTNALLNQISAQRRFGITLAKLRFETGTLITGDPQQTSLRIEGLTSIPRLTPPKKQEEGKD